MLQSPDVFCQDALKLCRNYPWQYTLELINLAHNKCGYHNFGYHNFSRKFCKFLVYNNFSHIFRLFETIFHSIYLIFPLFSYFFLN